MTSFSSATHSCRVTNCSARTIVADDKTTTGADYNYGVGGFIGNCRGDGKDYLIQISNVIVGTLNQESLT